MLLPPINLRSHVNSSVEQRLPQVILAGVCDALLSVTSHWSMEQRLPQVILRITGLAPLGDWWALVYGHYLSRLSAAAKRYRVRCLASI